jgi:Na+/proline symporter
MKSPILLVLFPFFILLILVAILPSKVKGQTVTGFFLGDRKLNPRLAGLSTAISARGSWILLGLTTQAYLLGLTAVWAAAGFIAGDMLMILFIAPLVQKRTSLTKSLSLTELIAGKFPEKSSALRIIITVPVLFFLICFISAQLSGGSRVLFAFLGLSLSNGVIITGTLLIIVIFFGGFESLSFSDILNGIILISFALILPVAVFIHKDGFVNVYSDIRSVNPSLFSFTGASPLVIAGSVLIGLCSPGFFHVNTKFMALGPGNKIMPTAIVNGISNFIIAAGAIVAGILARVYFPGVDSIPGADAENVFVGLAGAFSNPMIGGFALIAVLSAVVASAGSQSLVCSSSLIYDLYLNTARKGKKKSDEKLVFYSRTALVAVVYFAMTATVIISSGVTEMMTFAMTGLGASLGPVFLFSLLSSRLTQTGVKAGIIAGGAGIIILKSIHIHSAFLNETLAAIVLSVLAILAGNRIEKTLALRKFNRQASYNKIKKGSYTE